MATASPTWQLRRFTPDVGPAALALFRDTIRRVNCRDYEPEQIRAWASDDIDVASWTNRFEGRFALVAESEKGIVGFGELKDDGHLDRFYVHADCQGQGVGRLLLDALLAEARRRNLSRLFVEASITARPFFERFGFAVVVEQTVECRGVRFTNFRMEKELE